MMMKLAKAVGGAGIDAVQVIEAPIPVAGPGQALVRLHAATLNFRDMIIVRGMMKGLTQEPDVVPFSCGAGEVVSVGEGVTRVKQGDRVTPIFTQGWISGPQTSMEMLGGSVDGTARQYGVFSAESLCLVPDMLGDLEAATLPCAGLTAWSALTQHRTIAPGEWVLCHGTGGVSIAALQFAKAMGGRVVITSSCDAKLNRARSMGADVTINYRSNPDWEAAVRDAVGGNNIAIVVDVIGVDQFEQNAALLKADGLVAAIGMLGSDFSWGKEGQGVNVGRITVGNRDQHEAMTAFIEAHAIRPVVDAVYDLERIQDAYRLLESGKFFGKVAVSLR
jgi:NADPH:quinone reductase-like Zn-dependent oxidoreductase